MSASRVEVAALHRFLCRPEMMVRPNLPPDQKHRFRKNGEPGQDDEGQPQPAPRPPLLWGQGIAHGGTPGGEPQKSRRRKASASI
jgi:hypothetical protein